MRTPRGLLRAHTTEIEHRHDAPHHPRTLQLLDAERQEGGITTGELAERAGLPEVELEAIFAGERDATVRELAGLLTGLGRELQARDIKPRGMGI